VRQFERDENSFCGRYKQHDIHIDREDGKNWYIAVQAPSGLYAYDGYWIDSAWKSLDDAIVEACMGAMLWAPNAALRGDSGLIAGVPLESTVMQQEVEK